jgi:hypothetical protein
MLRAHATNVLGSFTAYDGAALEVGGGGQLLLVMLRAEAELELPLLASRLLAGVGFEQARISRLSSHLQVATRLGCLRGADMRCDSPSSDALGGGIRLPYRRCTGDTARSDIYRVCT